MSGLISRIGSNLGTLAAKATGLAALGAVAYDAHVIGKLEADTYSQSREAARLTGMANNLGYLETPSVTMDKAKKWLFNFSLSSSILMPFEALGGYFKGFASSCANSIIPATLGIFALLGGKKTSPLSALGLVAYGAYRLIGESFGIGRIDRINKKY